MSLSAKDFPVYGGLEPPPYNFSSSANSVFSVSSEDSNSNDAEPGYELESPQVYDAHEVRNPTARRANLPRLITNDIPSPGRKYQYSAIHDSENVKLFIDRTSHLFNIFQLSADRFKPFHSCSVEEIMRASSWWFLHGYMYWKSHLEQGSQNDTPSSEFLQCAQTSIAKAIWLFQELLARINTNSPNKTADRGSSYQNLLLTEICKVIDSMSKHGVLTSNDTESVFSPSTDCSIWVDYPSIGVDMQFLLTGKVSQALNDRRIDTQLLQSMPLGSSKTDIYYTALSVDVYIFNETSNCQQISYPALLSVVRDRNDSQISVILASQDGQLNFRVRPGKDLTSSWENVIWLSNTISIEIRLPTGFRLQVRFSEADFKILNSMYKHHNRATTLFERGMDEELTFQTDVEFVECRRTLNESVGSNGASDCRLRLFHNIITRAAGTGPRKMYRGSRLVILTPTTSKHISVLEYEVRPDQILEFGHLRGHSDKPSIFFRMDRTDYAAVLVLSLATQEKCNTLLSRVTGCHLADGEDIFADVQLNSFSLAVGLKIHGQFGTLGSVLWQRVRVINSKPWHDSDLNIETSTTVLSECLRIVVDSSSSRFTDRLNLGIGELRFRRNVVASGHELHILREPQKDLIYSHSTPGMTSEENSDLTKTLVDLQSQPSIRTFNFPNAFELHRFQAAITGFSVLYDGTPASFSISRRRLLVPNSKERLSLNTRVQIVRRKEAYQLIAFFEGFKHGKSMNFSLRKTDIFQMIKAGSKIMVKLVDAKFSSPNPGENIDGGVEWGFVNLDALNYPSENNNITIGFESHVDYTKFTHALPASVKTR